MQLPLYLTENHIKHMVEAALAEDVGQADVSGLLIPNENRMSATIITREPGILAGVPFANAVVAAFHQPSTPIEIVWKATEGQALQPNQTIAVLKGHARSLLTLERTLLNFLQTLSGTATLTQQYVQKLQQSSTILLDTRKTLPLLRLAQKYAVTVGGGQNHRLGLYDQYLIKENHIHALGGITEAMRVAKQHNTRKLPIEIEVENLEEFQEALASQPDIMMLDNFSLDDIETAVRLRRPPTKLEVSGNVTLENIEAYAKTGVDFISVGSLTKHVRALDLSMRFE